MIVSRRMAVIPKDIHEVWKIVTSVEDAGWRSDLSRTEILNERQFVEYTKKGYPTIFPLRLAELPADMVLIPFKTPPAPRWFEKNY